MGRRKIKILRIINRFNIGGPTYNVTFLTKFLSDDFETLLVGGIHEEGETDSLHILEEYGVKPILIKELRRNNGIYSDHLAYKKLKQIIREYNPDIVHTHASKSGALGRRAAAACNVPIIIHTFHGHIFHSYFGTIKTAIYKAIERNLAKKSTRIIAISDLQKQELANEFTICEESKITVVPLGFDLSKFQHNVVASRKKTRMDYNLQEDELAIAIIGRLTPIKNHLFFLDVIRDLTQQTQKKITLFIVGDGELRSEIEHYITSIQQTDRFKIIMTSWIRDIATFNPGMDIICLTSNNEGTPVSLIEAQACNVAVISTDVGGVRDCMLENETGFIVTKGSKMEYTQKLLKLIENEVLRKSMAEKGWTFVRDRFHYTTLVKNIEDLYRQLLIEKQL